MDGDAILMGYGMRPVAAVSIEGDSFLIRIRDEGLASQMGCVYGFVVAGEIVRIGSSTDRLTTRIGGWRRDVSATLAGTPGPNGKFRTPPAEAAVWREILPRGVSGTLYARQGTTVETPVGKFRAFMDEERVLIATLKPKPRLSKR